MPATGIGFARSGWRMVLHGSSASGNPDGFSLEDLRRRLRGFREPPGGVEPKSPSNQPASSQAGAAAIEPPQRPAPSASGPAGRLPELELGAKSRADEEVKRMGQPEAPVGTAAVAKVFESTKVFRDRLAKLVVAFDEVDRLGKDAASAFDLVTELCDCLSRLGEAYAPVRAFQTEVTELAEKFEPLKGVQNQFAELSRSFHDQLNLLAVAMEPAGKLQERLLELAKAFAPAVELRRRFEQLSQAFDSLSVPSPSGPMLNGSAKALKEAVDERILHE